MARLILMRHAKSDWSGAGMDDFSRPLNKRGIRDARNMGRWLVTSGFEPRGILSSPSRRTRETLNMMAEGAGVDLVARAVWIEALYLGSPDDMQQALRTQGAIDDTMVLAHNPGMEDFLAYLLGTRGHQGAAHAKAFPTAAVYVLKISDKDWPLAAGSASVEAHQRPKELTG